MTFPIRAIALAAPVLLSACTTTDGGETANASRQTLYKCADGSIVRASYPTAATARIRHEGRDIDMTTAISASGARYVGGGREWWTKGMTKGTLSRLAPGDSIASDPGTLCTADPADEPRARGR